MLTAFNALWTLACTSSAASRILQAQAQLSSWHIVMYAEDSRPAEWVAMHHMRKAATYKKVSE